MGGPGAVEIISGPFNSLCFIERELSGGLVDVAPDAVLFLPSGLHFSGLVKISPAPVDLHPACSGAPGLVQVIGIPFDHDQGISDGLSVHDILHAPGVELLVPCGSIYYPPVFEDGFFAGPRGMMNSINLNACDAVTGIIIVYVDDMVNDVCFRMSCVIAFATAYKTLIYWFIPSFFINDRLCASLHFYVVPLFVVVDGLDYLFPSAGARICSIGCRDLVKRFCNAYRFRADGGSCFSVCIHLLFFDSSCQICAVRFNGFRKPAFLCRVRGFNV